MKKSNMEELEAKKLIHELKNALTICHGYIEIMEKDPSSNYISIIKKEIKRSLQMIYNNSLNLEEIEIDLLLKDVHDTVNHYYSHNNCKINLEIEEDLYLEGDYDKLKQVFLNIIKNSYEANANRIVIKEKTEQNNYQIIIEDNGEGIDKQTLQKIGKESFTTKEHGTGIGLAYCKEVILKHGGHLDFQSKKGIGMKTIITIPKKVRRLSFNNNNY